MRITAIFAGALLMISVAAPAQITREQARSLVHTTLRLRGDKIASKQIRESTDTIPGYYTFGAYRSAPSNVQDIAGWFAVNQHTGQVWDTTSCDLYAFPTLERQRKRMVRHARKSQQKPPCSEGQHAHVIRKKVARRSAELPEVAQ